MSLEAGVPLPAFRATPVGVLLADQGQILSPFEVPEREIVIGRGMRAIPFRLAWLAGAVTAGVGVTGLQ
jgi:hypothetical protein